MQEGRGRRRADKESERKLKETEKPPEQGQRQQKHSRLEPGLRKSLALV